MLTEILALDVYRFLLLSTRLGTALMLMPGYSGRIMPARFRVLLTLAISFLLLPVLGPLLPPLPTQVSGLAFLVATEILVGGFIATVVQVLLSAINIAGTFIGFQIGLTNAFSYDAVAEQQSTVLTTFLTNLAMVVLFATDLHHLMLRALVDTYVLFPPGQPLPLDDISDVISHTLGAAFNLGLRLSAPLLVAGLVFYAGMGLMSRLAPQMQVFFVALPLQVMGGLWLLMVTLPVIYLYFLRWFDESLIPFLVPR